jgi:hypothetical protein
MDTITRNTFFGFEPIKIPIFNDTTSLIIDCKTNPKLECVINYRDGVIHTIEWNGLHQKPKETFNYKTKNDKKYFYVEEYWYRGLGTLFEKKLAFIV